MISLVNFPYYIHFEIYSLVLSFVIVISGCHNNDVFNPSLLDLSPIRGLMLSLKATWQYLDFIFNRKLMFHQHIDFYANKALSMVKSMKMLGNLTQGLLPYQKYFLYRTYVLSIVLYSFSLWYYNKAPLSYLLNKLNKIQ